MSEIDEIRARILAAPTSSAGDPPWLADAKVLLDKLETALADRDDWCDRYMQERELTKGQLQHIATLKAEAEVAKLKAALDARGEPVAWRVKDFGGGWIYYRNHQAAQQAAESTGAAIQGLFPPTEAQSAPPPTTDREKRLVEVLEHWQRAHETGRHEPCVIAYENAAQALGGSRND